MRWGSCAPWNIHSGECWDCESTRRTRTLLMTNKVQFLGVSLTNKRDMLYCQPDMTLLQHP